MKKTFSGFIARDGNGEVWFYLSLPHKVDNIWSPDLEDCFCLPCVIARQMRPIGPDDAPRAVELSFDWSDIKSME